jgi:Na+/proline symporter
MDKFHGMYLQADLYAGSIFLDQAFGLKQWYLSVSIILLIAGIFTISGGLTAVIWTDLVQAVIMIAGAIVVMTKSMQSGPICSSFINY